MNNFSILILHMAIPIAFTAEVYRVRLTAGIIIANISHIQKHNIIFCVPNMLYNVWILFSINLQLNLDWFWHKLVR